jgi:hypothetical protein
MNAMLDPRIVAASTQRPAAGSQGFASVSRMTLSSQGPEEAVGTYDA